MIATVAAVALLGAIAFIGTGYLHTHRAARERADRRAAVHAMSLQALAAAIAQCDAPLPPDMGRRGGAQRDEGYCEEVGRELDDRPLEAVPVEGHQSMTPTPNPPAPH